jgi:DNA mismatch repair protein MutS2
MKHFCRMADKHTLFLIDELGSGSDPVLGGAFAESILEHLAKSQAMGVVTTHYLNLKILAQKTNGIVNGAMEFDEENLLPLFRLVLGKPGSSYTFAIAERIGMQRSLIDRAKQLVDREAYKFDELLKQLEQDKKIITTQQATLAKEHSEFEVMKRQYQTMLTSQQDHIDKAVQAAIGKELTALKETEQKLKQLISEWKTSKDKNKLSQKIANIMMKNAPPKAKQVVYKKHAIYVPIDAPVEVGALVKVKTDNRLGKVVSMRNNRVVLDVSGLNIEFYKEDVIRVEKKEEERTGE